MMLKDLHISGLGELIKGTEWHFAVNESRDDCSSEFYSSLNNIIKVSGIPTHKKIEFIERLNKVYFSNDSFIDKLASFKKLVFNDSYAKLISEFEIKAGKHVINYAFMIDNYEGFIDSNIEPVEFTEFKSKLVDFRTEADSLIKETSYGVINIVCKITESHEDRDPYVFKSQFSPKHYKNKCRLVLSFPLNAPVDDVKNYLNLMPARKDVGFGFCETQMLKHDYEHQEMK